jgi:probable addiction module antidote protein
MSTKDFDFAEYLDSPEVIAAYLAETFKDGDAGEIAEALGEVARAKGMTEIAKKAGMSREGLYKALSADGHPEFTTILKVMKALDVELAVTAKVLEAAE